MSEINNNLDKNVSVVSEALGNTKPRPPRKRSRRWCITLNNYSEDEYNSLMTKLSQLAQGFIVGKETGSEGTPHLQGYIEFKSQREFATIKKLNERMHILRAEGTRNENIRYCSKEGDFFCNMKMHYEETPDMLQEHELYPWQRDIVNNIVNNKPDNRIINWIYDVTGNNGKSVLCAYLYDNDLAEWIQGGKASDIKNVLFNTKKSRDICIDLSRSVENYVSYTVMEELKNGYIYSGKYEGGCKRITTPHVYVFANFLPDKSKLSMDRWKIFSLNDKILTDYVDMDIDDELL